MDDGYWTEKYDENGELKKKTYTFPDGKVSVYK